jgi:hypothetical protein
VKTEAEILYEAMDSNEWTVVRSLPWSALTDEANEATRWYVERKIAPFCGRDGIRRWVGATPSDALDKARQSLGDK